MAVGSINQWVIVNLNRLKRMPKQQTIRNLAFLPVMVVLAVLAGCHSFTELKTKSALLMPNLNILQEDMSGIASVHCSGGVGCQFVSLNNVELLNPQTGEPTEQGKTDAVLRFESPATNDSSQYFLALTAAPHDVELLFYPIARDRVEKFKLTHRFKAGHRYDLKLYRQEREQSASLLSLAGPAPLCVDMLDDDKVVRRFCRTYGFQTMTTSFVEQKLK